MWRSVDSEDGCARLRVRRTTLNNICFSVKIYFENSFEEHLSTFDFFIEPRSDHWIALSLSHSINQPSPFVKVVTFNCQSFYMNLSTVLYIFDKLATYICLRKSSYMYLSKPSYVFLALCEGKPSCLVWFGLVCFCVRANISTFV